MAPDSSSLKAIVEATLHSWPKGQTHWSTSTMAEQFGVSRSTMKTEYFTVNPAY
jgi:hypothetical protein